MTQRFSLPPQARLCARWRRSLFGWLPWLLLLAPFPAISQAVHVFSDWIAACDNLNTCTATSYAYNAGLFNNGSLQIYRDAGAAAKPYIMLRPGLRESDTVSKTRVLIDDRYYDAFQSEHLSAGQSATLLNAMKQALVLSIQPEGYPRDGSDISLRGLLAALRWMDERQGRTNNVTALVARGKLPLKAVPAPSSPPLIGKGVPIDSPSPVPDLDPQILKGSEFADCEPVFLKDREAARLGPDKILWIIPCAPLPGRSSYAMSTITLLVMTDGKGRHGERFQLPLPPSVKDLLDVPEAGLNLKFLHDGIQSILYRDGRGHGQVIRWRWDGERFEPVFVSALNQNVINEYTRDAIYPLLYRAATKNADGTLSIQSPSLEGM